MPRNCKLKSLLLIVYIPLNGLLKPMNSPFFSQSKPHTMLRRLLKVALLHPPLLRSLEEELMAKSQEFHAQTLVNSRGAWDVYIIHTHAPHIYVCIYIYTRWCTIVS